MRKINLDNTNAAGKKTIKEINEKLILNLIREHQPTSRVQIANKTRLQRSTVTIITNRLLEQHWVLEGEDGPYGGGRKPKNLYLNSKKLHCLGVEVGKTATLLALADLNGKILTRHRMETRTDDPQFFARLAKRISHFADDSVASTGVPLAGVGVSLAGYIEKSTGKIIAAENFGWMNVPAGELLRQRLDIPIYFENNAKLAAFAEIWFGNKESCRLRNFIYVTTRDGLGTGIIINGEIYNGARDGAAEFGHVSLFPYGERCVCGNYGCWEIYASEMAVLQRYAYELKRTKGRRATSEPVSINEVIERAHQGEAIARKALQDTAKYLGLGIANLVYGFNPEMVIVGDNLVTAWDLIGDIINSTVRSRVPRYYLDGLKIVPTSVTEIPALLGAIALVLAHVFSVSRSF